VVYAVLRREARTRYGSSNIGYVWAIVDSLVTFTVLIWVFTMIGRNAPDGMPLTVFFVTGIVPLFFWRGSVTQGTSAVSASLGLLTYPQVMPADIVIARLLLEAATIIVVFLLFVIGLYFIMDVSPYWFFDDPPRMLFSALELVYFTAATMFFSSNLARVFPIWVNIWGYISRPVMLTSGLFFTLKELPDGFRQYMIYNPVSHIVESFRSAAIPTFDSDVYSIIYPMTFATVALLIGLVIDRILLLTGDEEIMS